MYASLWLDQRVTDTAVKQQHMHPSACVKGKSRQFGRRVIH